MLQHKLRYVGGIKVTLRLGYNQASTNGQRGKSLNTGSIEIDRIGKDYCVA